MTWMWNNSLKSLNKYISLNTHTWCTPPDVSLPAQSVPCFCSQRQWFTLVPILTSLSLWSTPLHHQLSESVFSHPGWASSFRPLISQDSCLPVASGFTTSFIFQCFLPKWTQPLKQQTDSCPDVRLVHLWFWLFVQRQPVIHCHW